jgi:pimeloyl-ACP methyl ester carboxylesterase
MALQDNIDNTEVLSRGQTVRYYDSGPHATSRETIVLLHGTGGSADNNFWALFPMLAMRHRVVALDFADPETHQPDAAHYVEQVLAVVRAIGQPKVHLAGYSFGAVIGAEFAALHGENLHSLTLVAGWAKTDTQQRLRNDTWRTLHHEKSAALAGFLLLVNFSQSFLNSKNEAEVQTLLKNVANGTDRARKMAFNRSVDITGLLPEIDVPCLVVGCLQDQTAPIRHSKMLFGGIKNGRYAEINSGHGVVHERPAELFSVIDGFVREPNGVPAGHVFKNSHA